MWWWFGVALALQPQVRDAVMVHDCDAVLAAVPSPALDTERLAVGFCLKERGRRAEAAELLEAVEEPLRPYAQLVAAQALEDAHPDRALAVVGSDSLLPGRAGRNARLLYGRVLVKQGRSLEARPTLRALLESDVGVEARYWLAVGGEDRGDTQAAIATYRRVWSLDAHGPWSTAAAEALKRLGAPVPDASTEEGRSLLSERAETLRKAQDHVAAAGLLALLPSDTTTAAGSPLEQARALFRAKDYPGMVAAYTKALGPPLEATGSARDLFDFALGTSRTGDYDTAAAIYRRVVALHPGTEKGDFASFKLGYLEYDRGNCEPARRLFAEHLSRVPESKHATEALWFSARCAWKSGQIEAAKSDWERLASTHPTSSLAVGARYWSGRSAGKLGDAEAERDVLRGIQRRHPHTAYAWFAAERLGGRAAAGDGGGATVQPAADPTVVGQLLDAGFPAWAAEELAVADHGDTDLWVRAGLYGKGQRLVCPEASIVQQVAERYGLDANLPYAIMTAESGRKAHVTSPAGARGLMQLMPREAPRVHAELYGDQPYDPMWLYEGPYNASLGTALLGMEQRNLGDLLSGNDLPAVIAAYNGGPDAVRRWVAAYDSPPEPDEFAEDIGYTETRRYVKRVLGYLMRYRAP
jgi:soluble lytic murein transglycosylase-like protein